MSMELKKRSEINVEDTWRMEDMLPSDSDWEALFQKTKDMIPRYEAFRGRLAESADIFYECLEFDSSCSKDIETLYVYGKQKSDEDTRNVKYQDFAVRGQMLANQAAAASSFIIPEILSMEEETIGLFLKQNKALSKFQRSLQLIMRRKAHTLSAEMEQLLAYSLEATQGADRIFSMFNNADLKFPAIEGENGESIRITHGNFIALLENKNRGIRKAAFEALYSCYKQYGNTLAATFSANLKQASFYAKARNYTSAREYYLDENEIPETVYDNLLKTVQDFLPVMHRYVTVRKNILGLEELHMYDLYVPIVDDVAKSYSFETAKKMVLEGLEPLGGEYIGLLRQGFDNRWIDVYENEGKKSGAYSWGVYGTHPYVLLNYNGTLDYVFTLAHEMGHALHSYFSDHNQSYADAGYKIFVAEVASTCNEALLIRHLIENTEDKKERAYLINHFLESFRSTLLRQTMFAEFEAMTHMANQNGETLTAESLCRMYHQLNEKYYGPDVVVDGEIDYEWERIPHFYTPFYVYQYATGFSAAIAISSKILKGEKGALEGYFNFLKGGNSMSPIQLLKLCGIDMSTTTPVKEALEFFKDLLDEFESLITVS